MRASLWFVLGLVTFSALPAAAADVLIVADEFPAMEVLAAGLEELEPQGNIRCSIVSQEEMPEAMDPFAAVFVYIHRELKPGPEEAFIRYARGGGRLILLHHSISSGKRKNKEWFSFLGVELPTGELETGGYKWIEGVPLTIYPLGKHAITTEGVDWPDRTTVPTAATGGESVRPAVTFHESEVYLNHVLAGEHTLLLGLSYQLPASGKVYVQETAGWLRQTGRGRVYYFMPGHSVSEFESPVYRRILFNALVGEE